MKKSSLILKYFQKLYQLTVNHEKYQKSISSFFAWLVENDKVNNDKTTKYFPNITCQAKIVAKQEGIIAGIEEVEFLLKKYTTLSFKSLLNDGSQFKNGAIIAEINGKSHEILGYERTILNILQRMSGIASETSSLISLIRPISQIQIASTRKTPWMSLDKKAVAVGGGLTHRLNLSDEILIKDNHIATIKKDFHFKTDEEAIEKAIKSIIGKGNTKAIKTPQGWPSSKDSPGVEELEKQLIEIEVENFQQAHQVIKTFQSLKDTSGVASIQGLPRGEGIGTDFHLAIMLDNFTPSRVKMILSDLGNLYNLSSIIFEASGGINEKNILEWSQTGVDILSLGSLTHSTHAANLSLEFVTK